MHGGETASPVRMLKAPRWKLHSTMSSSMKPSDKEPGPWVQESSVTKMDPLRLKTASTNSPTSTLIAAPTGTSEGRQMKRRSVQARVTPSSSVGAAIEQPASSNFTSVWSRGYGGDPWQRMRLRGAICMLVEEVRNSECGIALSYNYAAPVANDD